eukprot:GHVR01128809.1.p1 GENE.GHVR01128809.1~~GHVR01128809.1.p1  ORF type:complete len:261 (-),score=84.95 GHVR01128809.1:25-717(-)
MSRILEIESELVKYEQLLVQHQQILVKHEQNQHQQQHEQNQQQQQHEQQQQYEQQEQDEQYQQQQLHKQQYQQHQQHNHSHNHCNNIQSIINILDKNNMSNKYVITEAMNESKQILHNDIYYNDFNNIKKKENDVINNELNNLKILQSEGYKDEFKCNPSVSTTNEFIQSSDIVGECERPRKSVAAIDESRRVKSVRQGMFSFPEAPVFHTHTHTHTYTLKGGWRDCRTK